MTAAPAATPAAPPAAAPAATTAPGAARAAEPSRAARVQQAAARAAERVEGVHALGTATGRALVRAMGRVPGGRTRYGAGVSVEVGTTEAAVDVSLVAEHGTPLPALAGRVRSAVRSQVEREAGVEVVEVNVSVVGLHHPDDDVQPEPVAASAGEAPLQADGAPDGDRDADETVQRIVARAVEDAAEEEDRAGAAVEHPGAVAAADAANPSREDGDVPTVVLSAASAQGDGPDVVVADQVVLADEVVVVDHTRETDGEPHPGTDEEPQHRRG